MEVTKNQLCRHDILSKDCVKCQILAFLSVEGLHKNIIRYHIFKHLKEMQKVWTFNIRCAYLDEREGIEPDEGYEYTGLTMGTCQDVWKTTWPCYKFIFVGSFDAVMGFITCFLLKYSWFALYKEQINVNSGYEEIQKELNNSFLYNQYLEKCVLHTCPDKTMVVNFGGDIDEHYFCINNLEEYMAGYREMMKINIPGIQTGIEEWEEGYI